MFQEFERFFGSIDDQKIRLWLLSASEISHSYSQKLLVMTDKEKSTEDQVQEEYSMDPRYSEIVSMECLHDSSCVPEVDSYTVVKIFGRLSEDGQTVSGLSGSSLAEKMLTLSHKTVPVFSLDGNTTTDFQHNFMRTFMAHGLKVVIEINQGNQQTYKVISEPDTVSRYEIPQKKVDHTTQYDHQHIIMMENDPVVQTAATYLSEKHPAVSSIYVLDENQRPKLIHGDSVPLSEESRLVLVGHGAREDSGEMKLSGYKAEEVSNIIKQTNRVDDKIKTISIVACELGSDKTFAETLLRELHASEIETELHLRDAVVQVRHTGEKITQEISSDGVQWQHRDDSKKVVALLDKNGKAVFRNEPGSKGEAIFTNEQNVLINTIVCDRFRAYQENWPQQPRRFLDQSVFEKYGSTAPHELEALSWGFFHEDLPLPRKVNIKNLQDIEEKYRIRKYTENEQEVVWTESRQEIQDVLSNCYKIKSGDDVRNIIRHYAKTGEKKITYLMVKDWIYAVNPQTLYVYLYGKKLNNNQIGNTEKIGEIERCVIEQIGNEKYPDMRKHILDRNIGNSEETYVQNMKDIFLGERTTSLSPSTEAWCTTYFTASVISESARNFRTFPLTLMALEMTASTDNNIQEKGLRFFFEEHPMAKGRSWINPGHRGFSGTATAEGSTKLENRVNPPSKGQLKSDLDMVVEREVNLYRSWNKDVENVLPKILEIAEKYEIITSDSGRESIQNNYNNFKEKVTMLPDSGPLGGYNDGHTTAQDLMSASKLENSFKLESHFSRLKALITDQVDTQLKAQYGENLAGLHLQEGSCRIDDGEFIGHLVSERVNEDPVEFRVKLSPESKYYSEKTSKTLDLAVQDLEVHSSTSSHEVNKYVEHTGTAFGAVGLILGMKGAVRAFEEGDIEHGVMGTLQTTHGVAAMTTSVIAKQALSAESRIAKAASAFMKSPAMKGTMAVLPVMGIGFGVYNLIEDVKRGGPLGYIDAALDVEMIVLDVLEMAQPELAPFIAPVTMALSIVRMVIDDVYISIENELKSLSEDATVLDKVMAGLRGFEKGLLHFTVQVESFFYDWGYEEIVEGHRLAAQISDYHEYYRVVRQDGINAIDFSGGDASWNGGGIDFCLADQGQSELCMDYFVSRDESLRKTCWNIDTQDSKDIILGLGESHQLEHKTIQKKVLMFIPAGSAGTVVSGYQTVFNSRYGKYKGNRDSNRFFAIQGAKEHMAEVMLTYYYELYGEPGDDTFFLGPQRSYVQGSGGKDTYIIPKNGGKTIINNYDPSKALDTLHFSVDYSHISVSKSGDHVVLMYEGSHTVVIEGWFLGELYRHMTMVSGDGVLFDVSSTVVSSVQLVAKGINKMFQTQGQHVDASEPLLSSVINIYGTRYDDVLIGNKGKNLIDGGGGRDRLKGGEEEDIYIVKSRQQSSVSIENYSTDTKTDMAIIEADLHSFKVSVEGDNVVLNSADAAIHVTLLMWFRSAADRHLLVVTKDLVTFKISDNKADCLQSDPFSRCIKSLRVDYSSSKSPQVLDLQADQALDSVTEVRGSKFDDVIIGNKEHNVLIPGMGNDFLQGRGGQDWYVVTPGQGVKTINNYSPDLALDLLFLQEEFKHITATCEGKSIRVLVSGHRDVILENWFDSKSYQHLQIKTKDGVTAELAASISSCSNSLVLPVIVDSRNLLPEPTYSQTFVRGRFIVLSPGLGRVFGSEITKDGPHCSNSGRVMMNYGESVKDMYGSSGFDIIVGNSNDNLLDPYTGGALMSGGEGRDTYIIKHGYGNNIIIDNFAEDGRTDKVLLDMDFMDGSQVILNSSGEDLKVIIKSKGEELGLLISNYRNGVQYQHIEFQSSDGVDFKLKSLNSTGDEPLYDIEAFKVTLKQSQVDCHLDLNSQGNLSKVHTVQGCASQSNNILGNAQDNVLMGGLKDDAIEGGEGHDTLIGGEGNDLLLGDVGDDTLYGEDGDDTMMGGSGQDVFIPGPGADMVDGGPGRDSVLYRGDHDSGKGVYVNLLTGQCRYADAEGDVLKDVEIVVGTIYSDVLVSGYESALLKGSDGNDILVSTGGDYLVGGDGNDVYLLAFHQGSVTIDNCAKDNATDVLFLSSRLGAKFNYERLPDRVVLTFYGFNQTTVKVTLTGWTSDDNECGHLKLVFRGLEFSVDWLLTKFPEKVSE